MLQSRLHGRRAPARGSPRAPPARGVARTRVFPRPGFFSPLPFSFPFKLAAYVGATPSNPTRFNKSSCTAFTHFAGPTISNIAASSSCAGMMSSAGVAGGGSAESNGSKNVGGVTPCKKTTSV